jgi:hypothetical protein
MQLLASRKGAKWDHLRDRQQRQNEGKKDENVFAWPRRN